MICCCESVSFMTTIDMESISSKRFWSVFTNVITLFGVSINGALCNVDTVDMIVRGLCYDLVQQALCKLTYTKVELQKNTQSINNCINQVSNVRLLAWIISFAKYDMLWFLTNINVKITDTSVTLIIYNKYCDSLQFTLKNKTSKQSKKCSVIINRQKKKKINTTHIKAIQICLNVQTTNPTIVYQNYYLEIIIIKQKE